GVGGLEEPPAQLFRIGRRQLVAVGGAVLDHGLWAQAPVEVVVQRHLRQSAQVVNAEHLVLLQGRTSAAPAEGRAAGAGVVARAAARAGTGVAGRGAA